MLNCLSRKGVSLTVLKKAGYLNIRLKLEKKNDKKLIDTTVW